MKDCVFCKIIKEETKNIFLYQDLDFVVFNSNALAAEHHLLIVPKNHINSFMELSNEILGMTKVAQKMVKDLNLSDGYKMIFNGGKYQEVPHVHWHLLAEKLEEI